MHNGKYVFSQLLDFIDKDVFLRIANKYRGNRYVKQFTCYNQLAVLMFGQLSNRESLRDVVLATQAHSKKAFHLGFGKHASRSTLSDANSKRDYRIFEEFAYKVVAEARACRADDIFKLGGDVYAFDSTTIELCLETFKWTLYRKNQRKGGIKVHTLYDIETSIPTFFRITEARGHDMNAMDVIPYEESSFYIFDRGYNDFKRLHNIERIGACFVVRGKKNNDFRPTKWTRRFPPGSGILSDAVGYMDGQLTMAKYPAKSGESNTGTKRTNGSLHSLPTHWISARWLSPNSIVKGGGLNSFSSGSGSVSRLKSSGATLKTPSGYRSTPL